MAQDPQPNPAPPAPHHNRLTAETRDTVSTPTLAETIQRSIDNRTPHSDNLIIGMLAPFLWSRDDPDTNEELAQLLTRHGLDATVVSDPKLVHDGFNALADIAIDELFQWCRAAAQRLGDGGVKNPTSWLPGTITRIEETLAGQHSVSETMTQISRVDNMLEHCSQHQIDTSREVIDRYAAVRSTLVAAVGNSN